MKAVLICSAFAVGALAHAEPNRSKNYVGNTAGPFFYYSKFVDGGCATHTQQFIPCTTIKDVTDIESCSWECTNRVPECSAFAFCDGSNCKGNCDLFNLDPTESNHYPSTTCYAIDSISLYNWGGYLQGGCATEDSDYPPKMHCETVDGHMKCEALCNEDHNCGSYDYSAPNSHCCLFSTDLKITRFNRWPETTCHMKKITNARGQWLKVITVAGGGSITESITVGSETTEGKSVTETLGEEITAGVTSKCEFLGAGVDASMSATASASTAVSITDSLTRSTSFQISATCPSSEEGKSATMYQWWVVTDQAKAYTQNFRCHYTTEGEQPPQCPYGFCTDPLCQAESCSPWQSVSESTKESTLIV